jgi:hypothetical protein
VRTDKQGHGVPAQRVDTFWVVLSGSGPFLPLRVDLPCGREAMALFSGEEEARMFCSLREEAEANPHLRETSVGEVLSLLYCPLTAAKHVALDPLPEVLRSRLLGLITLDREHFARSFAGVGTEGSSGLFARRKALSASVPEMRPADRAQRFFGHLGETYPLLPSGPSS